MNPLVSVIVTTYNHERYIADTAYAILLQRGDFGGVEIILGEDCSSDNTLAICQQLAEQYPDKITLIASTKNVGWRENYRRCVEAARGKYIAFCDGDDYWCDENRLSEQVALMEQDPSIGLCYSLAERRDAEGQLVGLFPIGEGHTTIDDMLHDWCVENCTTLARREAVLEYYNTEKPETHPEWLTDDAPMWIWFAAESRIVALEGVTAVHYLLQESVSQSDNYRKRIAFCDSLVDISLWFDSCYCNGKFAGKLLRKRMEVALWVLSYNGSFREYFRRWWSDVKRTPRLFFNLAGYGLAVKKVWRKRNS